MAFCSWEHFLTNLSSLLKVNRTKTFAMMSNLSIFWVQPNECFCCLIWSKDCKYKSNQILYWISMKMCRKYSYDLVIQWFNSFDNQCNRKLWMLDLCFWIYILNYLCRAYALNVMQYATHNGSYTTELLMFVIKNNITFFV